jgi:hypothetical protein
MPTRHVPGGALRDRRLPAYHRFAMKNAALDDFEMRGFEYAVGIKAVGRAQRKPPVSVRNTHWHPEGMRALTQATMD